MQVSHTCILANKENKLSYKIALLEGLENQTITRKCTSNTFSTYVYKKHMRGFRREWGRGGLPNPPPPNQDNSKIFKSNIKIILKLQKICMRSPHPGKQNYPNPEKVDGSAHSIRIL